MRSSILLFILLPALAWAQVTDPAAKLRLAQGLEQAGEFERAALLYRELAARDPSQYVYFDGCYRMAMQLKHYDEATRLVQQRIAVSPADPTLMALLGTTYYRAGNEGAALESWDKVLSIDPKNPNLYRLLANTLVENRLLERAGDVYRRGREACGDPMLFTLERAQLLAVTMDYHGATREYLAWLRANPTQLSFVQSRMSAFAGKPEARAGAIEEVKHAIASNDDVRLQELLAWLYLEGKDFGNALEAYRTIDRTANAQGGSLYAFADKAYKAGAYRIAADAYEEAIRAPLSASKMPYAHLGYALSMRELLRESTAEAASPNSRSHTPPRLADVIDLFREVVSDYPHSEFSARSYYYIGVLLYDQRGNLDSALAAFDQVDRELPPVHQLHYDVALRRGLVLTAKGDTTSAESAFTIVVQARDALPAQMDEARFRLAEIRYFGGRFDEAVALLSAITTSLTSDFSNDALELLALIEESRQLNPQALQQFAAADFLCRQRKEQEALALYSSLPARFPDSPLVDDALMRSGDLQEHLGRYQDAIKAYELLLTTYKDQSALADRAEFRLGRLYEERLNDIPRAIATYEQLLAQYPNSILADDARRRIRLLRGDAL